jgi:rubrerythrin
MSKTDKNLQDSFAGESQAKRKYPFFQSFIAIKDI